LSDSTYTLCIDDMNDGNPDSATCLAVKQDRFDKALALIAKELALLPARVASPLDAPPLPSSASDPLVSRGGSDISDH
jgi:hypothetical protein